MLKRWQNFVTLACIEKTLLQKTEETISVCWCQLPLLVPIIYRSNLHDVLLSVRMKKLTVPNLQNFVLPFYVVNRKKHNFPWLVERTRFLFDFYFNFHVKAKCTCECIVIDRLLQTTDNTVSFGEPFIFWLGYMSDKSIWFALSF